MEENKIMLKPGLKPHIDKTTDFKLGAIINWPALKDLPPSYSIKPFSIKDQITDGNDDFCVAASGDGMIEPQEEAELYYEFLFAAAKYESGDDPDTFGLAFRDVGAALVKWGIPEAKDVPDSIKNLDREARRHFENYPQSVRDAAAKHKQQSYFFVNGPYDAFDNARAAQWYFRQKKQNVMFGVQFAWNLSQYVLDGVRPGSPHAMWQSGWFSDNTIECTNSAGLSAGINGQHKITRQAFNAHAKEFGLMMVVDIPRDQAQHLIDNNIKLGDNWFIALLKTLLTIIKPVASVPEPAIAPQSPKNQSQPMQNTQPTSTPIEPQNSKRQALYEAALAHLGTDASPADEAPDELGCAETVFDLCKDAGINIADDTIVSTEKLLGAFIERSDLFTRVTEAQPGVIIICATGTSKKPNAKIAHGHTGIFGEGDRIMSNDSATGKFLQNYTLAQWVDRYRVEGGYPIYYFQPIN